MSRLNTISEAIVTRLATVTALQTNKSVLDANMFLGMETAIAPAAITVFDGETAGPNKHLGGAMQEVTLQWSIYLLTQNFALTGEVPEGEVGAYALIDSVFAALEGYGVSLAPISKLYYVGTALHTVLPNTVIYRSRYRMLMPLLGT